MRHWVGFALALALVASPLSASAQEHEEAPNSAALAIHGKSHAPLQLMLRASYFYDIGVDPLSGAPVPSEPSPASTEEGQSKGMSRKGKIAVGVVVPLAAVAIGLGIGAAVVLSNWESL